MSNSMIFSKSTTRCDHHHNPVLEHRHHPSKVSWVHLQGTPTPSPVLGDHSSPFCVYRFASSEHFIWISYKTGASGCGGLHPVPCFVCSLTAQRGSAVRSCCRVLSCGVGAAPAVDPSTPWYTLEWCPLFGYFEKCCCEHVCTSGTSLCTCMCEHTRARVFFEPCEHITYTGKFTIAKDQLKGTCRQSCKKAAKQCVCMCTQNDLILLNN